MITITHPIAGREATIRVLEDEAYDLDELFHWLAERPGAALAVDTETTGLDIFSDGFKVRTVQLGIGLEAWVIPVEEVGVNADLLQSLLGDRDLYLQNAAYDYLATRQFFGYEMDWARITDTKILAHLVDSRAAREGGTGHSLQELTARYLDETVAEEVKGSMAKLSKETGLKKGELFAQIDVWNRTYLLYAGMDVILTYGLRNVLMPLVPASSKHLVGFEHKLADVCSQMEFNGFLLDREYAQGLSDKLQEEQEVWEAIALVEYGTESVNANAQVAEDLIESGVKLTKLTDSGQYKMDKTILEPLVEAGHTLAIAVTEAKRAKKWRTSWVDTFLEEADSRGVCHANINPLRARTGRMSITGIPAQTLPASDWMIRRCFIPDPGHSIVSCDYQAQELRVLAALSGDKVMQQAFAEGADLHQMTADSAGVARSVGKTVNFAYVYGSGPANIAETCGITFMEAKKVIQGFERTYPGVKRLSENLQKEAKQRGYITTPSGRRLYVDKDRAYSALNYMIQSTSRDITAAALLRLSEAGFTKYLRLPIHDEVLACVPEEHAEWGAKKIASIMQTTFMGVVIEADADVLGASWGGGYIDDESKEAYEATFTK